MRAIAVDWSGATHTARSHIWLAEAVHPGELTRLQAGRNRDELATHLLSQATEGLVVGLDFAFSFPAWFLDHLGLASAPELWAHVTCHGETWLAACEPPFWGRPGGIMPKSIFQVGGAGAVGTGSIRGMPLLHRLHAAGATIWPFDTHRSPTVVEIYPRLMTGPVRKSEATARRELLARRYPNLAPEHRQLASDSEDAFDAAVSALVMIDHSSDLAALPPQTDSIAALEGRIWHPRWREDPL
jgi:hypothetical protein